MNITNICLLAPVTDGWNYQDNLLTKYQQKNGHNVTIITSHWVWGDDGKLHRDERESYINEDGVKVIRIEMSGSDNFYKKFKKYPDLYNVIDKTNPDFLFIHGVSFLDTTVIAKYLKNNSNVKANADNHADFSNSATNWISKNILHRFIWRYYAKQLVPYIGTFFGVLPARVKFMNDLYKIPNKKCKLLLMGADDELVNIYGNEDKINEVRYTNNILDSDFLIVTGGKIDKAKEQTLTLMQAINELNLNIKLLIFGTVEEGLMPKFSKLLSDKVQFVGWANNNESYSYLSSADLVVFPGRHSVYREQTVGLGKPMVVKKWSGTDHIDLGGNVIFLKNDSVDEMKNVLLRIINDDDKIKFMKNIAEKLGKSTFSYSEIARKSIS